MKAASEKTDRIIQLDALRGLAVIGIVWMNVFVFALPAQGYYNPLAFGGDTPVDRLIWAISFIFVEDKFRTLFAMLFGAGCIMLLDKGGDHPWRAHFARMAVLFVIGLAHATLFASNDILRAYALAELALPLLSGLSSRALIAVAIGLIALHIGGGIIAFGAGVYDWLQGRSSDLVLFAERNFGSDPAAVQNSLRQGREGFGERVMRRLAAIPAQIGTIAGAVPINLAAMALGMALWRNRMLAAEWRTFRLQRLAAVCAIAALPALFAMASWLGERGFPGILVGPASLVISAPFDVALGVAYAAIAMALFAPEGAITKWLSAVGRLSLTNYVMTSVILSVLFASWGAGLFGQVGRAEALVLALVPVIAMLFWSPLWLRYVGQGPLERLWRVGAKPLA